jgi:hypothetical protein
MSDTSPPLSAGGLTHFDLPTTFRCAVELGEAVAVLAPSEWADLPVDIEGPASPHVERWMERHRRLQRINEETQRLKRSLGATGPLGHAETEKDDAPKWESYDQRFNNTTHDRIIRLALTKLATAAIDLSGFATWRDWQWRMRESGLRLLVWGLAQLWDGMSGEERSRVRDSLQGTHRAIGWPADPASDPAVYDGPEQIPLPEQYRIVSNYISCYGDYLNDVQMAENMRLEQGQVEFLRRATLAEFVETAERAAQALQAMWKRDFDTSREWGDLYTKAFWPLASLRRAHEIQPREVWPLDALEQRRQLAGAAGILLSWVGGTPEAKGILTSEEAEKAFTDFTQAILRLRVSSDPRATKCHSQVAAYSLGKLFDALHASASAFAETSRTADRVEAKQGAIAAQWWRVQAAAFKFQPNRARMPGIDRIQLLCDELDNGGGLTAANVAKLRAKVCRAEGCTLEAANALTLDEFADILEAKGARAGDQEPVAAPQALRTPAQLLEAFASAAARFQACPRMVASLNSAREDGLVTVPSSFVPRKADGQPVVGQLNIGGTSKTAIGPEATFYGIGGAQIAFGTGNRNVGFFLYGWVNDEAAATFRELGGEAGVIVHVHDLVRGLQSYDRPLVLWCLVVYETLQGSTWLSQIDGITENPALHFNPFLASVETLKRLLARNESLIEPKLIREPDEAKKRDATPAVVQGDAAPLAATENNATLALMRIFTNGIADDRIKRATQLLADNDLTVNEKLTKIDALIPFPATASAEQLGGMLGVSKQAILKTDWWIQNRRGEKENEVGRRREGHRKRAKTYEGPGQGDDE